MKRFIAGCALGVAVAASGVALAATNRYITLRGGDQAYFQGVLCTTNGRAHAVACALADRFGYTVGITRQQVIVLNRAGKPVFFRRQP